MQILLSYGKGIIYFGFPKSASFLVFYLLNIYLNGFPFASFFLPSDLYA